MRARAYLVCAFCSAAAKKKKKNRATVGDIVMAATKKKIVNYHVYDIIGSGENSAYQNKQIWRDERRHGVRRNINSIMAMYNKHVLKREIQHRKKRRRQ